MSIVESNNDVPNVLVKSTLAVNFGYAVVLVLQLIFFIRQQKIVHWFHIFAEYCAATAFSSPILPLFWLAAIVAVLCTCEFFFHHFDVFGLYTIMFYDLLLGVVLQYRIWAGAFYPHIRCNSMS